MLVAQSRRGLRGLQPSKQEGIVRGGFGDSFVDKIIQRRTNSGWLSDLPTVFRTVVVGGSCRFRGGGVKVLELDRGAVAEGGVASGGVVERFDPFEDRGR